MKWLFVLSAVVAMILLLALLRRHPMTPKTRVIFDTSSWNQLLKDPMPYSVIRTLKKEFFVRLTATNISEIAATPNEQSRKDLLSVCERVLDDCLWPPHWITNALIRSFEQDPASFDWHMVRAEWPELQEKLAQPNFFDNESARVQSEELRKKERDFRDLYGSGRAPIEEAFRQSPGERPASFHQYLQMVPGELLKKGQSFYQSAINHQPSAQVVAQFMSVCSPFRALIHMAYVPEYEHWIRSLQTSESYRAGANDLFSAVYLCYCNKFVTHDERQLNALKLVIMESDLKDVEVLSYEEFKQFIKVEQ